MSAQWVIRLALADAASLAPLRLTRGIEVAEKERFIWIRGDSNDEKVERNLRSLPAIVRYELSGGNRLRQLESRIPSETLPILDWQPLSKWLRVQVPVGRDSLRDREGVLPQVLSSGLRPISLRIVRSTEEQAIELLVTSLEDWREFAVKAPELRLRHLRFAVDAPGNVVIRGKPLPPLPGRQFVVRAKIAVQAGFTWEPAVSADVLTRLIGLSSDGLALLYEDGTFSRIEAEQFVPATRSAVRETAEGFGTR